MCSFDKLHLLVLSFKRTRQANLGCLCVFVGGNSGFIRMVLILVQLARVEL